MEKPVLVRLMACPPPAWVEELKILEKSLLGVAEGGGYIVWGVLILLGGGELLRHLQLSHI